ncbi:hypothetical protein QBC43DRAFT_295745 [Cladorrhinum sp. PSN259]|nr:hypothetical protein QBC43DRAFT_295745 [Cladorrhinum sp. PSN259]
MASNTANLPEVDEPYPKPSTFVADEDGDLILRIGSSGSTKEPQRDFIVCSATLRRSSPVFKKMLFGPWAESKPNATKDGNQWIVQLPEDDPAAFEVPIAIMHGLFSLVSLAKVPGIRRMLYQKWMDRAKDAATNDPDAGKPHSCEIQLTYLAWKFGDEQLFTAQVHHLISACAVDEQGRLIYTYGKPPTSKILSDLDYLGPPDLIDIMAAHRLAKIGCTLDAFNKPINARLSSESPVCFHIRKSMQCHDMVLGAILKRFAKHKGGSLGPLVDSPTEVKSSPTDLGLQLSNLFYQIQPCEIWTRKPMLLDRHESCLPGPAFTKFLVEYSTRTQILTPEWKARMAKQREKLGLENPL